MMLLVSYATASATDNSVSMKITDKGQATINKHQSLIRKDATETQPKLPEEAGTFEDCLGTGEDTQVTPTCVSQSLIECHCKRKATGATETTCCHKVEIPGTEGT